MGTCFCETGPYKEHFACFSCRKMFKKPSYSELSRDKQPTQPGDYRPPCPECGQKMHNMGKEFEPPKRTNIKRWREIEANHKQIQQKSMTTPKPNE